MTGGGKPHGQYKTDPEEDGHCHCSIRFPPHPGLPTFHFGRPPLDGAEPGVAEEVVGEAPGSNRLVPSGGIGRERIPARHDVLDPERVAFVNAHGERRVPAEDALRSVSLGGTDAAAILFASRHVEHGIVAADRSVT